MSTSLPTGALALVRSFLVAISLILGGGFFTAQLAPARSLRASPDAVATLTYRYDASSQFAAATHDVPLVAYTLATPLANSPTSASATTTSLLASPGGVRFGSGYRLATKAGADDALRALPRGRADLTQNRLEHIVARHWSTSGAKGAGKFSPGTTGRDLRGLIDETAQSGAFRPNTGGRPGQIYERDFGSPIGTSSTGSPASRLRVVVGPDGRFVTAFPY